MAERIKIEIYAPPGSSLNKARGLTMKVARIAIGLTLRDMAEKMHRSKDTILRWERGEVCPDLDEAKAIANCLGQPMGFLEIGIAPKFNH